MNRIYNFFRFPLLLACFSFLACSDEQLPDWEKDVCNALEVEDYERFIDVCNNYLKQNESEELSRIFDDFVAWLNDMNCLDATAVCFECLPFEPPASGIEIKFLSTDEEQKTKEIVVISFLEAMFLRVSEVR